MTGSRIGRLLRRRRRRGVNVVGYLDAPTGLGERARELVATLRAGGVAVGEWTVPPTGKQALPTPSPVFDTTIAMVTAVELAGVRERLPQPFAAGARTIGYFFWELPDVPDEQQWGIGLVDEIWTPTRFVLDAYRAATTTVVRHVPLPLPRFEAVVDPPDGPEHGPDRLDVLVSFDLLSVMERKNPLGAIEAFRRAFPDGARSARLTVKTLNGEHRPEQLARLRAAAGGDPRIVIRDEHLPRRRMVALIAASDVVLSLHRAEGLGLHLAEAMSLGTLVVASRYGGNLDLMDDHCAALVDVALVEVSGGEGAYAAPARWADPDLDMAAALLRRAHDDPAWRRDLCRRASATIAASPTRPEIGANLTDILW